MAAVGTAWFGSQLCLFLAGDLGQAAECPQPQFSCLCCVDSIDWKKIMHNLKVENDVLFGGLAEDSSLGGSLEEVREEPGCIGVFIAKTR